MSQKRGHSAATPGAVLNAKTAKLANWRPALFGVTAVLVVERLFVLRREKAELNQARADFEARVLALGAEIAKLKATAAARADGPSHAV